MISAQKRLTIRGPMVGEAIHPDGVIIISKAAPEIQARQLGC